MGGASLVKKMDYPADYNIMRGQFYLSAAMRQNRLSYIETNMKKIFLKTNNKVAAEVYRMHHMLGGRNEDQYFATKSFQFCRALADGSAQLKPGIDTFTETGCKFKSKTTIKNDESVCTPIDDSEVELDDVILCTGFKQVFPFLPDGFEEHSHLERYCLVFHPKLKNVGFVGFVRPSGLGSIPTLAEMQARWITQVFKGAAPLPNEANMKKAIAQHVEDFQIHRPISMGHVFVVWLLYLTKIATFIDATPPMATLFFTDYKLWYRMMFQPMTTHQFRLVGPHAKPDYVRKVMMGGNRASEYSNERVNKGVLMLQMIKCYILSCIPVIGYSYTPLLMKGKIVADK